MRATAKATRSGEWWVVEVPEVPGLFAQAKRLDQIEAEVVDAATMSMSRPSKSTPVARLRGDGLTVRDVASVLGLSPQ